jgi:hypothetical protein
MLESRLATWPLRFERQGLESTLEKLHDQGVYVTIDEFKGRRPIERRGLRLEASAGDFDNPWLAHHYDTQTGGSRGARRRIRMDLDLETHDAAYYHFFLHDFGLQSRPIAAWREVPPGSAGLSSALRYAKKGELETELKAALLRAEQAARPVQPGPAASTRVARLRRVGLPTKEPHTVRTHR